VKTDGCITPCAQHEETFDLARDLPIARGASHCCSVTILNATARRKYRLLVNPCTVKNSLATKPHNSEPDDPGHILCRSHEGLVNAMKQAALDGVLVVNGPHGDPLRNPEVGRSSATSSPSTFPKQYRRCLSRHFLRT